MNDKILISFEVPFELIKSMDELIKWNPDMWVGRNEFMRAALVLFIESNINDPDIGKTDEITFSKHDKSKCFSEVGSLCNGCHCFTHSIRKRRAHYICGKCGHDKTLGDIYQNELEE